MLPVLIRNIHQEVSAQELVDALNNNLPASAHVDKNHITFLSTGRSRSTILLFRRKSALRSIKKGPLPVLHGQEINIDTNFYGLNVLSEGTGPVIDIVALHGLNGHAFNTWATKAGHMWLRDSLPSDIPNARILTYGYDSNPSSASFAGIEDFALDFLAALHDKRRDVGTRKLILIGHSLGGILIKKALNTAHASKEYRPMIDYLSGIVFLGTPHQGSTATTPALYIARLAKVVKVRLRRNLIRILERDSEDLFTTARSFERFLQDNTVEIKSFYETRTTSYGWAFFKKEFQVVDQQSATPVQWGEPIPLNANHIEMCKFENSSAEYDKVWSRIKDLAGRNCVIDAHPTDAFYEAINASASERIVAGNRAELSTKDNEIYERLLRRNKRGFALYVPEPNKRLPVAYQKQGTRIGDVGIVTADGGFSFLFNICVPHNDAINPCILPEGFSPIQPSLTDEDVVEFSPFKSGSYLASLSIEKKSEQNTDGLYFETSASEGAVLTMPEGAISLDTEKDLAFIDYLEANMRKWYEFVYRIRRRRVPNGQIRLVIGCDKTTAWGIATVSGMSQQTTSKLKFKTLDNASSSTTTYTWECSGMAVVRVGPDRHEIEALRDRDNGHCPLDMKFYNQCLFVRTMNATLSDKEWAKLERNFGRPTVEDPNAASGKTFDPSLGNRPSGSNANMSGRSDTSNSWVQGSHKGNPGTKSAAPGQEDGVVISTTPDSFFPYHPSNDLNQQLLRKFPACDMVITKDQAWLSTIREEEAISDPEQLLERVLAFHDARIENGVLRLDRKETAPTDSAQNTLVGVPSRILGLKVQKVDNEFESPANVNSTIASTTPNEVAPVDSNPSTVNANPRHHTTPDQGPNFISGPDQDSLPTRLGQPLSPKDKTPRIPSVLNIQQPNTMTSTISQLLTKDSSSVSKPWETISIPVNPFSMSTNPRMGQIPSSSSPHLTRQSETQPQKPPPRITASIPLQMLKSNLGRVSDGLNASKSITSSRPHLPHTQKPPSQIPVQNTRSPLRNARKRLPQTDYYVHPKATSVPRTNTRTPLQVLHKQTTQRITDDLSTADFPSSKVPWVSAPLPRHSAVNQTVAKLGSVVKRRGTKPETEKPNSPASFDSHHSRSKEKVDRSKEKEDRPKETAHRSKEKPIHTRPQSKRGGTGRVRGKLEKFAA